MTFKAIVIGASAGGMETLASLVQELPSDFGLPIVVVQHLHPRSLGYLAKFLDRLSPLRVKEADEKEKILPGFIYIAPANYHLLIEDDQSFSLTVGEKVNFSRPSIDLLFETASDVYQDQLIGVILTGANKDGSQGLSKIKARGGLAIVEDPETAVVKAMPNAAIKATDIDYILKADKIAKKIIELVGYKDER